MARHVLYLIHSNQHSQHPKKYKKLGNKMAGDTEDSTIQDSTDREI